MVGHGSRRTSQLVQTAREFPIVVVTSGAVDELRVSELEKSGVEVVKCADRNLLRVLEELGKRSLQSVLVEGGSAVAGAFIDAGLVNKVSVFVAPKIVGGTDSLAAIGGIGVEKMKEAIKPRTSGSEKAWRGRGNNRLSSHL